MPANHSLHHLHEFILSKLERPPNKLFDYLLLILSAEISNIVRHKNMRENPLTTREPTVVMAFLDRTSDEHKDKHPRVALGK